MKPPTHKSVTDFQREIGIALKFLRVQAGFKTSRSFALKYDLPEIQYWRLENGRANVTLKSISKILKIHKIDIADFFKRLDEYKPMATSTLLSSGLVIQKLANDELMQSLF